MRKWAAALAVTGALAIPSAAQAAGPWFENVSPVNRAPVTVSSYSGVKVEFTCPDYYELSSLGYETKRNWLDYEVELSRSSLINTIGGSVVYGATLISGIETCSVKIPAYRVEPEGVYYWRVRRVNHEVVGDYEYDEATSFTAYPEHRTTTTPAPAPVTPTKPGPTTPGAEGGGTAGVTVWTGCGLSSHAPRSSKCGRHAKLGAFIKASRDITYSICVRFPSGERLCTNRPQEAEAGTTYVNKVTDSEPGLIKITWIVEGRRYVRHLRRL